MSLVLRISRIRILLQQIAQLALLMLQVHSSAIPSDLIEGGEEVVGLLLGVSHGCYEY